MWFDGDETTRRWGLNNLPCTASWQFAGAEDLAPQVCSEKCLYYESVRDLDPGDQRPAELIWLSRAKAARRGA
jgi:hypothetical protein